MPTIDQQFIEFIVKSLVENPDDVVVERLIDEKGVLLSLTVNPEDLGRVIGKRGVTAQSLRTLLRALGTKNDARYNLKIVNNDEGYERPARQEKPAEEQSEEKSEEPMETAKDTSEEEPVKNSTDEPVDNASDYSRKARQELAELDDLDI
jgi:predicted RNA-binding protein YlqC (UPF0109 family)